MVIDLVFHPDDRLTTVADEVGSITPELAELAGQMIEALDMAHGIGLAGPQVGVLERFFVVRVADDEPRVFINPRITESSLDRFDYEEGCLSIPGVYAMVSRPTVITVSAWDATGTAFTLRADGLLGRVIQHEYDHLNGVLFLDHLPERRRERLMKYYRKPADQSWKDA